MDFIDRTVLITGAATGIGRCLAVAFAREGADLALLDIDETNGSLTAQMVRDEGRRAGFYRADASSRESLDAAVEAAWKAQGPIALACANAGVLTAAPLLDMDARDIEWLMRVNVFGVLDTVRAYVRCARHAGSGGHVMLTGSENSVAIPPFAHRMGFGLYGMTKHAVLHMGDTLRHELAGEGIGVSVLLPGPVSTPILRSNRKRPADFGGPKEDLKLDMSRIDLAAPMAPQISPEAAARLAIEGLKAGRFMIPTHSHLVDYAQTRLDELAAATRDSRFEPGS